MSNRQFELTASEGEIAEENTKTLKPYFKPLLEELGDLRGYTLGPTPGLGESGNPYLLRA